MVRVPSVMSNRNGSDALNTFPLPFLQPRRPRVTHLSLTWDRRGKERWNSATRSTRHVIRKPLSTSRRQCSWELEHWARHHRTVPLTSRRPVPGRHYFRSPPRRTGITVPGPSGSSKPEIGIHVVNVDLITLHNYASQKCLFCQFWRL